MIRLEVSLGKFPSWLKRLPNLPQQVAQQAMQQAQRELLTEARQNVSKGHAAGGLEKRTGNLYNRLRTTYEAQPGRAEVDLYTPFYGRVNARGAVITPKRAPYLVFKVGGRWVKSKRVVIPARPWDKDALEAIRKAFPSYIHAALQSATGGKA